MKPQKNKKIKNILFFLIFIAALILFAFSLYKISCYFIDSKKTKYEIKKVQEITNIEEIEDNENTIIIEQKEEIDKLNPYWDYIKMDLINVDFKDLLKINNETVAWIEVKGTNINYPVVQANNNDYYLTHSFDKSYNRAGWVFMDYRNSIEFFDKNTILYAHGMTDKTMFGSLRNILNSSWYNNVNNHVIKLSTEYENTLWQVFSVYHIKTTNDYIQTEFNNNNEYEEFLNLLKKRSKVNFDTNINENDKILTLSTCYDKTDKVVMHAKLIKLERKK